MIENQQVTLARKIFLKFTAQCQLKHFIAMYLHSTNNRDRVLIKDLPLLIWQIVNHPRPDRKVA